MTAPRSLRALRLFAEFVSNLGAVVGAVLIVRHLLTDTSAVALGVLILGLAWLTRRIARAA